MLIGILCFAGYSYINSRLDLMQRLPWNPDEIKNVEISEEKQEQMSGYWTIAVFGVDSRNSSVGKGIVRIHQTETPICNRLHTVQMVHAR